MRGVSTASTVLLLLSITGAAYADRTIHFPDEAVGSVSLRPEATAQFGFQTFGGVYGEGWQEHGPAAGEVTIPDGFAVSLELNHAAVRNLNWVGDVPDGLIDAVRASSVPLGDNGFEKLSRVVGLRYLSLSSADLTSAIATHLPRLRRLQYLWIGSNSEVGDEVMAAIAALPELQSVGVYGTGVTDAGLELLSRSESIRAVYTGHTRINRCRGCRPRSASGPAGTSRVRNSSGPPRRRAESVHHRYRTRPPRE